MLPYMLLYLSKGTLNIRVNSFRWCGERHYSGGSGSGGRKLGIASIDGAGGGRKLGIASIDGAGGGRKLGIASNWWW
jgi:hypothetical protein